MKEISDTEFTPVPLSQPFRVAGLSNRKPNRFELKPDAALRRKIAEYLGILSVKAFRFKGTLTPSGRRDFVLEAELTAVIEQACGITLVPVKAEIIEKVVRRFVDDFEVPEGDEAEMPDDDTVEALEEVIDVGFQAIEALTLALPSYPRAPGAQLEESVFTAPGLKPLADTDLRPFAGLADLKAKLEDAQNTGNKGGTVAEVSPKKLDGS
jgi:uncharacterized metal-binding protein YceD (DUF177 family)